jgi:hypothetical protein
VDHQQQDAIDRANRMPSLLSFYDPILAQNQVRVIKNP